MIRISIPSSCIPDEDKHSVESPVYVKGQFVRFSTICFVSLTDEFTLDNAYDPDNFFVELSGNEFAKLIERDLLPSWAKPVDLIEWSTASCIVDSDRKITWVRIKENLLHV